MLVLRHLRQQKVSQEFVVSWGLVNGFREEPSTCCCSSVFRPYGHDKLLRALAVRQLWLSLRTGYIFGRHIYGCLCWLSIFFFDRTAQQNQPNKETYVNKIPLVESEIRSYFVIGANTKPFGARARNLNKKRTFQRDKPFRYFLTLLLLCLQSSRYEIIRSLRSTTWQQRQRHKFCIFNEQKLNLFTLFTCFYYFCTFLSRSRQICDVKWPFMEF